MSIFAFFLYQQFGATWYFFWTLLRKIGGDVVDYYVICIY
uniref:Uncharacterized protein n=1 Tax=Arundo donax TaxID=35708 RepID=A0A0A9CCJ5_ARUDO